MKVLVVDDEAPARERMIRLLADVPDIQVAGEAADGEDALRQIAALKPGLVLLDVGMPKLDGLSLAQRGAGLPAIIFVTAHDEFAVQAFEVNAVDYLLKPVRPERLRAAIDRARQRTVSREQVGKALESLRPPSEGRVLSTRRDEVRFFEAKAISRFWSSDKYTLFRADGEEQLTEESLVSLEQRLASFGFVRTHRAELINLTLVRALKATDGVFEVELADGQLARVSRRSLPDVRKALGLKE